MSNVYVRLSEEELTLIRAGLGKCENLKAQNLVGKLDVLLAESQPGTTFVLEGVAKSKERVVGCDKAVG